MRMSGFRSMLSRATPSRSFSLPGSTSGRVSGRRGAAVPPPAMSPPEQHRTEVGDGGGGEPGLSRWGVGRIWPRSCSSHPLAWGEEGGGAPSPSNRRLTPSVRWFVGSGWGRFRRGWGWGVGGRREGTESPVAGAVGGRCCARTPGERVWRVGGRRLGGRVVARGGGGTSSAGRGGGEAGGGERQGALRGTAVRLASAHPGATERPGGCFGCLSRWSRRVAEGNGGPGGGWEGRGSAQRVPRGRVPRAGA